MIANVKENNNKKKRIVRQTKIKFVYSFEFYKMLLY